MASRERWDQLELFPEARKVCSACGDSKLLADFHRKRGAGDGLQARCKVCNIGGAKRFHAENLEHCRRRIGAWIRKVDGENQRRALEYLLEHPCVDCGEADPVVLEFDHRGDKRSGIAQMLHWHVRWEEIAAEIGKCDVRCANCHRRRHATAAGWFRAIAMAERDSNPSDDR